MRRDLLLSRRTMKDLTPMFPMFPPALSGCGGAVVEERDEEDGYEI